MLDSVPLLTCFLDRAALRLPEKTALVEGGRRYTYAQLDASASALARALERAGVGRGDRVIVYADNTFETVASFWGVLRANAVVSIVNPQVKADKLAWLVNDCRARALVSDAHLADVLGEALPRCASLGVVVVSGLERGASLGGWSGTLVHWQDVADDAATPGAPRQTAIDVDLASIIYTSGSTGEPKGVMLTHRNMVAAANSVATYLGLVEDDVILNGLPLAFDYGLYQMIMTVRGAATLVLERSFAFVGSVLDRVVAERVTVFPGVPTVFGVMAGLRNLDRFDLGNVRIVTNTAAALNLKHIEFIRASFRNARLFSMYGLTECKRCTYLPPEDLDRKTLSVGIAIPNTEIWLVDDDGNRVGPGQVGQLVVRGATVMRGYWEKPVETAKKLRPGPLPGEQVLYTGDLCRMDDDGYLYFVARMDDVIKSRGEKVAPKEVESVIGCMAGVREVAVIGVPDDLLGQAVKAFVVPEDGVTLAVQDVLAHCADRLESFMVPKHVEFAHELPRTDTGKIRKTGLR